MIEQHLCELHCLSMFAHASYRVLHLTVCSCHANSDECLKLFEKYNVNP
jgi:hypothetical protein